MEIPPKIRIPLCIEQGCVYNFYIDFGDLKRESKNRYFVVLNKNPKTDTVLVMVTCTKQIDKKKEFIKKRGISQTTLVEVKAQEHCAIIVDSVFNCNDVLEVKMSDLIRKIEENGSMNYPKISDGILSKLIAGVKDSPMVPKTIKDII